MSRKPLLASRKGFALITAIFVMVILAMFGVLIARYVAVGSVSSSENYVSAQALYAAESAARMKILCEDGGGGFSVACSAFNPEIQRVPTAQILATAGTFRTLRVSAERNGIHREIEVKYRLIP